MKTNAIIIISTFILSIGCNNSVNINNRNTDSLQMEESQPVHEEKINSAVSFKELVANNTLVMQQINGIENAKTNRHKITSISEIEKVLKMRDTLIHLLYNDETIRNCNPSRFKKELELLGICSLYNNDGEFMEFDIAPLLEDVIERVADEPYIIRNNIRNLEGISKGTSYDIRHEIAIVVLTEKMINKYPGHQYNEEVLNICNNALFCLTDIHKVSAGSNFYIVGGYDSNANYADNDVPSRKEFIIKHSESRYSQIIKNILSNISTLSSTDPKILYIVEVPPLTSDSVFIDEKLKQVFNNLPKEIAKQNDCFKYMWLGIDIPYNLYLGNNIDITAYRFFDNKELAEESLKTIQKIIPSAKLVEYPVNQNDEK